MNGSMAIPFSTASGYLARNSSIKKTPIELNRPRPIGGKNYAGDYLSAFFSADSAATYPDTITQVFFRLSKQYFFAEAYKRELSRKPRSLRDEFAENGLVFSFKNSFS